MLELITIALLQFASFASFTADADSAAATSNATATCTVDHGTGGWGDGHLVAEHGTGGWGDGH